MNFWSFYSDSLQPQAGDMVRVCALRGERLIRLRKEGTLVATEPLTVDWPGGPPLMPESIDDLEVLCTTEEATS